MREDELELRLKKSNGYLKQVIDSGNFGKKSTGILRKAIVDNKVALDLVDVIIPEPVEEKVVEIKSPPNKMVELLDRHQSGDLTLEEYVEQVNLLEIPKAQEAIQQCLEDPNGWLNDNYPYFNMVDRKQWFKAMTAYGTYLTNLSR